MSRLATAVTTALLLGAGSIHDARAATVIKFYLNQAVASCQPALPAFDGLIRKRPKAVANEGTSTAFVSCAPGNQRDNFETVETFSIVLLNRNAASVQMTCTLVDGVGDSNTSVSTTKTITVTANVRSNIVWSYTADNGGQRYSTPSVSCALPPSTELAAIAYTALDEIGT